MLDNIRLPHRANLVESTFGLDSLEWCKNQQHFLNYPHSISYEFNSRGFRDSEWPTSLRELTGAIWCIGDSFTVGVGNAQEHMWTNLLKERLKTNVINVSLDGASNNWIARQAAIIISQLQPKLTVIHWSYIHRREKSLHQVAEELWKDFYKNIRDTNWPDCKRLSEFESLPTSIREEIATVHNFSEYVLNYPSEDRRLEQSIVNANDSDDIDNFIECVMSLEYLKQNRIIHSMIPNGLPLGRAAEVNLLLQNLTTTDPFITNQSDFARDYHHYGVTTANDFVESVLRLV